MGGIEQSREPKGENCWRGRLCGGADFCQTYETGSRQDFLQKCKAGDFDDVVGLYRSNDSVSVTGPFNKELVSVLPKSLKYIAHNGAGYDNIEVSACTERGIRISSTPIAVNDATADSEHRSHPSQECN